MGGDPWHAAKTEGRFAASPWTTQSARWRQIDAPLPHDHLARESRPAMTRLAITPLYQSYRGRGKAPHRPDLMRAIDLPEACRTAKNNGSRSACCWRRNRSFFSSTSRRPA